MLLTDLGLPDGSGIAPIHQLRRTRSDAQAMIVTPFGDERTVMAAIEAGATGYLLKDGTDGR
ncbi:MAG: response regulator [Myxococcota bacterium]